MGATRSHRDVADDGPLGFDPHRRTARSPGTEASLELAFVLLAALSAACGLLLRRHVVRSVGRVAIGVGVAAGVLALSVLALAISGLWPFPTLAAGLAGVALLAVADLALPFGLALGWPGRSDA